MTLLVFLITGYSRILRAFAISISKIITKIDYYIRGIIEYIIIERHKVNSYIGFYRFLLSSALNLLI